MMNTPEAMRAYLAFVACVAPDGMTYTKATEEAEHLKAIHIRKHVNPERAKRDVYLQWRNSYQTVISYEEFLSIYENAYEEPEE